MSFFGLMTVKAHREQIGHYQELADAARVVIGDRDITIGRLQREKAKLLNDITMATASRDAVRERLNVVGAELDHWRKHGQLRDPKTGRLIPRVDGKAAAMAERAQANV